MEIGCGKLCPLNIAALNEEWTKYSGSVIDKPLVIVQDITLVARCELHGVSEVKGSEVLLTINALNEFDSRITGVDWRQKIENQRGAVSAESVCKSSRYCVLICS